MLLHSRCQHVPTAVALWRTKNQSPAVVGDQVRILWNEHLAPVMRLWLELGIIPVPAVMEKICSSWTGICWRTKDEQESTQNITSTWTEHYAKSDDWEAFPFQYAPLLPASDAIRLLDIQPPRQDGTINLTLSATTLSQKPFFYALSYEWGPIEGQQKILLNGRPVQVRKNLFDFLTMYTGKGNTRKLWIDALCINQDDTVEKDRQVTLMGEIYETATCVHLWLGNEADNSDALFRHFRTDGRCVREFSKLHSKVVEFNPNLNPIPMDFPVHKVELAHLLTRSYWTRAWIVQELVLARDIPVHCGYETVSWSYLRALADSHAWSEDFRGTVIKNILEHKMVTTNKQMALLDILALYPNQMCQEPRDQIYSLLSLDGTLKSGGRIIEVDYEIDLCSLLLRTFNACAAGFDTRSAANFERLRLRLGLGWEEVLDSTTKPRYVKAGESWYSSERPFEVFAQTGSWGTVRSAEEPHSGLYAGLLFVSLDDATHDANLPFQECGLTRQAAVGDHIFGLFGSSLALIFRISDQAITFVSPMIVFTVWENFPREDTLISNFEHQLLLSDVFCGDEPRTGWSNFQGSEQRNPRQSGGLID